MINWVKVLRFGGKDEQTGECSEAAFYINFIYVSLSKRLNGIQLKCFLRHGADYGKTVFEVDCKTVFEVICVKMRP